MEKIIRTNKTSKMLRIDDNYSEIFALESALLKGDKLKANVRCRIARETKNPEILRLCIQDSAITVVTAAKENPILTPEMKTAISNKEKAWGQLKQFKIQEQLKQFKIQEETQRIEELEKNSKVDNGNKGCLWFIIITCSLGAIFSYLYYYGMFSWG